MRNRGGSKRLREDTDNDERNTKRLRIVPVIIDNINDIVLTSMEYVTQFRTPNTYKEAIESDEKEIEHKLLIAEMNSLKENQTWEFQNYRIGHKALPAKWVYKKLKTTARWYIDIVTKLDW
ncbi:hypothetical protein CVS40_3799 [Lucilia cuprina]|nr:hypothetical protein CVS40_3799 [Lucilia cuprina]